VYQIQVYVEVEALKVSVFITASFFSDVDATVMLMTDL